MAMGLAKSPVCARHALAIVSPRRHPFIAGPLRSNSHLPAHHGGLPTCAEVANGDDTPGPLPAAEVECICSDDTCPWAPRGARDDIRSPWRSQSTETRPILRLR